MSVDDSAITEHAVRTGARVTAYLACGPTGGAPMLFLHGWPDLAIAWREQLAFFGARGYRCIAPDMRGYGGSSVPAERDAYAVECIVDDMLALRRELELGPAVWVGHDWGAPIGWALAAFHPEACRAVASLCVPYYADGFSPDVLVPLVDRTVYPEETYPTGQWDYQYYYETAFDEATATFEADLAATFKTLIRSGSPAFRGRVARTAHVTRDGGWFDGRGRAPDLPRDPILSEADLAAYVAAFSKTGFAGADAWYANRKANRAYAARAPRNGKLELPVLFLHAAYDVVCETLDSRLAEPMRRDCANLTERVVESGHWMARERPDDVNDAVAAWLRELV
jgi:pimeloyl-ACP methyl ester carboxylesterase